MAFDQQLEADRIDGFNLFSAFVRVPLLVLGGILGSDDHSNSMDIDGDILSNHSRRREDRPENDIASVEMDMGDDSRVNGSNITNRSIQRRNSSNASMTDARVSRDSPESATGDTTGIKRNKKNLSWSDESGLPLVYENDESIPHQDHTISPYKAATGSFQKPTKSAMRKSRSTQHDSHGLSEQDKSTPGTSRYIPNMNPRTAGNGFIVPTRPYGGRYTPGDNKIVGSSGTESPQWGWYINTTPPTPELYHSRSMSSQASLNAATIPKNQLTKIDPFKNPTIASTRNSDAKSCQNQVFQNLQNSTKANPVAGWTSIPI